MSIEVGQVYASTHSGEGVSGREPRRFIRATDPYAYRSGEWAAIERLSLFEYGRLCWVVRFDDGHVDAFAVEDYLAGYEFAEARPC
jgi:hypothetical protein